MNAKLIEGLIEEGFYEVTIQIKPSGVLNTFTTDIQITKKRRIEDIGYDGFILEKTLKNIKKEMIEKGISFKRMKLEDLLNNKTEEKDEIII